MTNDEYITALAGCRSDPMQIAIVQANHMQGMTGDVQAKIAELILRFDAYEQRETERAAILADAVVERIQREGGQRAVVAEAGRAETAEIRTRLDGLEAGAAEAEQTL